MKNRTSAAGWIVAALVGLHVPAEAKVVFTGYGNLQMNAHSQVKIYGDAPALAAFKTAGASTHMRGFNTESVGLFATTNLKEGMDFLVDFTYRQIGDTTKETDIQYAFLEGSPWEDLTYRLGKITLPFGYYNQRRFYAFQRVELSAPIFQSAFLGLPIADHGAGLQKRFKAGESRVDVDVYAVNGYGATPSNPKAFRSALLPGSITIGGNIGPSNNNGNVAFGGRLNFADIAGRKLEAGISYYGGAWDSGGSKYFQMMNSHLHADLARFDMLFEYLHMDVAGDPGFAASVGDTHWQTDGYFTTLSYPLWRVREMPLTPYIGSEAYVSRAYHGGGGQENLQSYRAGLSLQALEAVRIKLEYLYFYYRLPLAGLGDLKLSAHLAQLALALTF